MWKREKGEGKEQLHHLPPYTHTGTYTLSLCLSRLILSSVTETKREITEQEHPYSSLHPSLSPFLPGAYLTQAWFTPTRLSPPSIRSCSGTSASPDVSSKCPSSNVPPDPGTSTTGRKEGGRGEGREGGGGDLGDLSAFLPKQSFHSPSLLALFLVRCKNTR